MRTIFFLLLTCASARFWPVRTRVKDRGGIVDINLVPVDGANGVLHLKMQGGRISRRAAERSIAATSDTIHKCKVCTIVVEFGSCRGVSPLALPVTAQFLLTHPELKHILIIEAKGAVLMACRVVKRLSGHDKMDLYGSFEAFEAACSGSLGKKPVAQHRRSALSVARAQRQSESSPLARIDALGARLRAAYEDATRKSR